MRKYAVIIPLLLGFSSCILSTENKNMSNADQNRDASFSDTLDGKPIKLYRLQNKNGMSVELSNYGATLVALYVPDKNGKIGNVVLGYDDIKGYYQGKSYFGCVVGRYANRIANGKFQIDAQTYAAPINNGMNTLHGGIKSIDKQVWKARQINDGVVFSIVVKDGENGYPGDLKLKVTYSLREDNNLAIDYEASTNKTTVINVTNHAYFNLTGDPIQTILSHNIQLNASQFTPVDITLIPLGAHADVANTPFDFRVLKKIGKDINAKDSQIVFGKGYDHNFVLYLSEKSLKLAAIVEEEESGRKMEVFTTEPGIQFYTGNFLDGTEKGRGTSYQYRSALCLETQHFPDSPNQPSFPTTILKPGDKFTSQTIYSFSILKK